MAKIHPSALIEGDVQLADDVEIGPGCVLQGKITLGPGCRLIGHVYLTGPITMGSNNVVYPFTCVNFEPQTRRLPDDYINHGVKIGNDNILREGVTIHGSTGDHPTTVGDRNFLMANSHLGHDVVLANDATLANGVLIAGHVDIQDKVLMGGNAAVHQFCRVGRMSMLAGTAGITQDLPPFCTFYNDTMAIGSLNLVGLRRNGLADHIEPLKRAFSIIFRENHAKQKALELVDKEVGGDPLCRELAEFINTSERGILAYHKQNS